MLLRCPLPMKTFTRRASQRADYDPLKTRSNSTASPIQQNSNDNSDPYAFTDAAHGSIKAAAKEDSQQVSAAAFDYLPTWAHAASALCQLYIVTASPATVHMHGGC